MDFELTQAAGILERTPATLNALLRHIPDAWASTNEGENTWSPFDVVGHLIHGEKTDWIPRARMILEFGEARAFEPFDRFAQLEISRGKTLEELLDEFERLRRENVETLRGMNPGREELARCGVDPAFGRVTLEQLLATWVVHDLNHLAQISRVMARGYETEVGPWHQYLSILHPKIRQV